MEPLTVLSYNVRHAALDDGPDAWERRRPRVAARIRDADPDLLGLQECGPDQHADVAADLSDYRWCGIADEPRVGENAPVGVGSRLSLVDAETIWLSESGDPESVGWDAEFARVLTATRIRDRKTGREFAAYNTHFDHVGTTARVESAGLLRERIDALPADRPAVAVGDFNVEPGRDTYERLLNGEFDRPLRDARLAAGETAGPGTTLTDFTDMRIDRRIDHVFVTPDFAVERYTVDATTVDGRYPSDHLPVIVDLVDGSAAEAGD